MSMQLLRVHLRWCCAFKHFLRGVVIFYGVG